MMSKKIRIWEKKSIEIEPEKITEYPDWEPQEQPLTIPEEWPEEVPSSPERELEPAHGGLIPCTRNIEIEPERIIEYPDWTPEEQPITIPEQWPEEIPEEAPVEPERVPVKVGSELEKLPYSREHQAGYGWKILFADGDGNLISPSQGTVWPVGQPLHDPTFDPSAYENKQIRNSVGIHTIKEGDWTELYGYHKGDSSLLVKCQLFGKVVEGKVLGGGTGYLSGKAIPVLAVGMNKKILLAVANKYGIDVQTPDTEGSSELVFPKEEGDLELYYGGYSIVTAPKPSYKGFSFQKDRGGTRYDVLDEDQDFTGYIDINVENGEVFDIHDGHDNNTRSILTDFLEQFDSPFWNQETYTEDMSDFEYEWSDYRSEFEISSLEDLRVLAKNIIRGYTGDYTESEGGNVEYRKEGTDEWGIETWVGYIEEEMPVEIKFSTEEWLALFNEVMNDIYGVNAPESETLTRGYYESEEPYSPSELEEIAQALYAVPVFLSQDEYWNSSEWPNVDLTVFFETAIESSRDTYITIVNPNPQEEQLFETPEKTGTQLSDWFLNYLGSMVSPEVKEKSTWGNREYFPAEPHSAPQLTLPGTLGKIKIWEHSSDIDIWEKDSDYFYDWQGYTPDDGSLDDGIVQPSAPAPGFINTPTRCPKCNGERQELPPGHMINLDQYDKLEDNIKQDISCPTCGYNWPMEYDKLIGGGERWNVLNHIKQSRPNDPITAFAENDGWELNRISAPHKPRVFPETAPSVKGPDGKDYLQVSRGMSDKEYKRWVNGEIISQGKYFTSLPRSFYVDPTLLRQTDEHTFTFVDNGVLQGDYIRPVSPSSFAEFQTPRFTSVQNEQFDKGVEYESKNGKWSELDPLVRDIKIKKIVTANLKEFPNYYSKLLSFKEASDIDRFGELDLQSPPYGGSQPFLNKDMPHPMGPSVINIDRKSKPDHKNKVTKPAIIDMNLTGIDLGELKDEESL